jgi:hypothetical protein
MSIENPEIRKDSKTNLYRVKVSVWHASHVALAEVDALLVVGIQQSGRFRLG